MDDHSKELIREIRDSRAPKLELSNSSVLPPMKRFRFSLGALLIVLSLAAIILGLIGIIVSQAKKAQPPNEPRQSFPHEIRPL
jgi:hypothetical protein